MRTFLSDFDIVSLLLHKYSRSYFSTVALSPLLVDKKGKQEDVPMLSVRLHHKCPELAKIRETGERSQSHLERLHLVFETTVVSMVLEERWFAQIVVLLAQARESNKVPHQIVNRVVLIEHLCRGSRAGSRK